MTDLRAAVARLPRWEQEAARRLVTTGAVTGHDEDDLLDLLLDSRTLPPDDLSWLDHPAGTGAGRLRVAQAIVDTSVGSLPPGATLTLDADCDICVIEAANGSGKTSLPPVASGPSRSRRSSP